MDINNESKIKTCTDTMRFYTVTESLNNIKPESDYKNCATNAIIYNNISKVSSGLRREVEIMSTTLKHHSIRNYLFKSLCNPNLTLKELLSVCPLEKEESILMTFAGLLDMYQNNMFQIMLCVKNFKLFNQVVKYVTLQNLVTRNLSGGRLVDLLNDPLAKESLDFLKNKFPGCVHLEVVGITEENATEKISRYLNFSANKANKKAKIILLDLTDN